MCSVFLHIKSKGYLFALALLVSQSAYAATQITTANVATMSRTPVIVVTSLGCDAGQMHVQSVERALKDLERVKIAWADSNETHKIFKDPPNFAFGSVLLVKDGTILDTSTEYNEKTGHANISSTDVRTWAYAAMTKHGVAFKMPAPEEIFSEPYSDNSPANLDDGLKMYYPLRNDLKDATGQQFDFAIGTKNTSPNGAYYMEGEYGYPPGNNSQFYNDGYALMKGLGNKPVFAETGGGLSVMVKPEKNTRKDNLLFTMGERRFEYWVNQNTGQLYLITDASCIRCGAGGKSEAYSASYYFPGVTIEYGKWYNFVVSVDLPNRRVMTLMNGKRLKDARLTETFVELNRKVDWGSTIAFRLLQGGWGVPVKGYVRDVAVYNRALNSAEMVAMAGKYGDKSTPVTPPDTTAKDALNKAYLQAVANGDLTGAKKQVDAGADVNFVYQNWSALNLAAHFGREDIVKYLIGRQADVLHEVSPGLNSQQLARAQGHSRIVALLENASNNRLFFGERKIGNAAHRSIVPDLPVIR